jgi:hypothetical protein
MTNGRPPAINGSTALGGRLSTSIRIRLSQQEQTIHGGIMKMQMKVIV